MTAERSAVRNIVPVAWEGDADKKEEINHENNFRQKDGHDADLY